MLQQLQPWKNTPHCSNFTVSISIGTVQGRVLSTGGWRAGRKLSPKKNLLKKKLQLFQIKIFLDDDFKESVKVTNVQKCDFSQS